VASLWLFILEEWCKYTFKSKKQTNYEKVPVFFVGILKVTDEKSRIRIRKGMVRIRIRIKMLRILTLPVTIKIFINYVFEVPFIHNNIPEE
jgi:hypothetical protein